MGYETVEVYVEDSIIFRKSERPMSLLASFNHKDRLQIPFPAINFCSPVETNIKGFEYGVTKDYKSFNLSESE